MGVQLRYRSIAGLKRGDIVRSFSPEVYVWHCINVFQASGMGIDHDAGWHSDEAYLILRMLNSNPAIAVVLTPQGRVGFVEASHMVRV